MAQFNAPKNPPWVRAESYSMQQVGQPSLQQQIMGPQLNPAVVQYQQTPTQAIYSTQLALQQQAMSMQQMVANSAQQIYNPQLNSVAAAVARPMNAAFVQPVVAQNQAQVGPGQQQQGQVGQSAATATKQRVFTGTVTKVVDSYGFVDEDVFFQMTVVKGPTPVVNDRVLVEAVCLPNMPFKWNATRIQVLPMNEPPRGGGGAQKKGFVVSNSSQDNRGSGYNAVPPPGDYDEGRQRERDNRDRRRMRSRERTTQSKRDEEEERRRRRERREKEDKEREEKKERERVRSRSPKKPRPPPVVRKYRVRVPERPLDVGSMGVSEIRGRYRSMYLPSDVFRTMPRWQEAFPSTKALPFTRTAQFFVLNKDVDPIFEYSDNPEPPDADYLFSAKVMLLSFATTDEMMKKCMLLTEELDKDDGRSVVHPSRLINCLVGFNSRGKNETMAIGGPWSPSLDGADPATDPTVLIKTAIRTCRALTGVDLTPCSQWFRIVEIYYHRSKTTHKGKEIPARVETVVIYVPDVWTAMPSCLEWDGLHLNYKKQLDRKLAEAGKAAGGPAGSGVNSEDEKEDGAANSGKEPTHYSLLDPKTMKVSELRDELAARSMNPKGLRLQLMARLAKQLKTEQETDDAEKEKKSKLAYIITPASPPREVKKEDEKEQNDKTNKKDVKDKVGLEEKYVLPEMPHILVHPSRVAKAGRFNCKLLSLSILLDYSSDTTKEHTFEVSLFAELFNEMLMRYFGIQVYQAVQKAKEETTEEDDKDKKEKEEEEKDKEDASEKKVEEEGEKKEEKSKEEEKEEKSQVNGKTEKEANKEESDDENSKDSRDRDRREKKERERRRKEVAQYTADKKLLLAFSYFDVSHYGRISGAHLEDLIHTLGLHLSRSQVKKLVGKVVQREYCDYRKLTDLPVGTEPVPPTQEDPAEENLPVEQLGNRTLLPVFHSPAKRESLGPTPAKRVCRSGPDADKEVEDKLTEGFVMYKGAQLNVENLKAQAAQNEEMRLQTETKLIELNREMNELREKLKTETDSVKSLNKELKGCKSTLGVTREKLHDQVASADIYLTALMDIEERLIPILDTDEVRRLIRARQSVIGAPSINLVPLSKVEDIERSAAEHEDKKSIKSEVVEQKEMSTIKAESETPEKPNP